MTISAGLTGDYKHALKNGFWPSLDVLPEPEREETGRALKNGQYSWPLL